MKVNLKTQPKSFASQLVWLGASEGVARITRLLTAVILARYLSPFEFGIAALVLSSDEIIRVLSRNGFGLKIIKASDENLEATCAKIYRFNWLVSISLAILQMIVAQPIANAFSYPELANFLQVLALTYLIYPFAMVQVFRVQRQQNMRVTGSIYGLQVGTDNILTAVFAIAGLGVWAVVLPKLLVAPIWVLSYRKIEKWRFNAKAIHTVDIDIWHFCRDVLGVEFMRTARLTWDKLIIGAFLGIEALGIYFFAMNAGSGLALALIRAFNTALMPRLCVLNHSSVAKANLLQSTRDAFGCYAKFVVPLIVLQVIFAPLYVPIVFGNEWVDSINILMVLCVAVIFQGGIEVLSPIYRAHNKTTDELRMNICVSLLLLMAVMIGCQFNLLTVSISILCAQVLAFIFAIRHLSLIASSPQALKNSTQLGISQ